VQRLTLPKAYAMSRRHLFGSDQSFQWFYRLHRTRLIAAGALYRIAGRNFVDPEAVDRVVAEVGLEAIRRGAAFDVSEVAP